MGHNPTPLQQNQCAWAVAWQDHGDQKALGQLVWSVERLVHQTAGKYARTYAMREDLESECRLAAVEAAEKFDRDRPDGYVSLCKLMMKERALVVVRHTISPISGSSIARVGIGQRIQIKDSQDDEGEGVALESSVVDPLPGQGISIVYDLFDEARLDARERRILSRFFFDERREDTGAKLGVSRQRIGQIEHVAIAKVRSAAEARGLVLSDLL